MKFGGHETFFLRPGWITKGLHLVSETEKVTWNSEIASDTMGVGRNMSKSIGWWLNRAGLTERPGRMKDIEITEFGHAVLEVDPYMMHLESWWFIHLALTCRGVDDIYGWFFRSYRELRFTRDLIEGALITEVERQSKKQPAQKTLERDINVLLQSYANPVPRAITDPEDNLDCPLRGLGLLAHRRGSRTFERREPVHPAPPSAIAATLALTRPDAELGTLVDVPLDLTGPVRVLSRVHGTTPETFIQNVTDAADRLGTDFLSVRFLANQRVATVRVCSLADWLLTHADEDIASTKLKRTSA